MVPGQPPEEYPVESDTADHIAEARQRARQVLAGEANLANVDDWRTVLVSARDALILIWLTWLSLLAFEAPAFSGFLLVAMAMGIALLVGISAGRSTHSQVQYYAAELERERGEIRDHFEHECSEVRVLYAAKGFREPLLSQIVDTLSADDDRLLKVMMEEELGLSMHHMHHPLVVGAWNFGGALIAGLALAWPVVWFPVEKAGLAVPISGGVFLAIVSVVAARATGRSLIEFFTVGVLMAGVTGGVVYLLSQWFVGFVTGGVAGT